MKNIFTIALPLAFSLSSIAAENPTTYFRSEHPKYYVEPSGETYAKGILARSADGQYSVDGQTFKVVNGKTVNGTNFNQDSAKFFLGKSVEVILKTNEQGELELRAIVPADLYSSAAINILTDAQNKHLAQMLNTKKGTLKRGLSRTKKYQDRESFRATIVNRVPVRAGDSAFIVTLSGHQGDDKGSLGGHFAYGRGRVGNNGELYSELTNFYPLVNEKEIKAGHINTIDYFGNITGGQTNYRPTWTAIIYGLSEQEIMQAQTAMNDTFDFLASAKDFSFTYLKNCSTESVNTLKSAGVDVYTAPESYKLVLLERIENLLNLDKVKSEKWQTPIAFAFKDKANSLPRKSFEKVLGIALSDYGTKAGITRIDFIYHGQTVSDRKLGGLPIGGLSDIHLVAPLFLPKK